MPMIFVDTPSVRQTLDDLMEVLRLTGTGRLNSSRLSPNIAISGILESKSGENTIALLCSMVSAQLSSTVQSLELSEKKNDYAIVFLPSTGPDSNFTIINTT
jgi:hypothetical protein